jgi:2-C-methyl-D-erythritol 4-phosphate cytidylyltransferase
MSEADLFCVIVAGGLGVRMGTGTPKQFLLLAGKPMLMHSMTAFHQADPSVLITVVLPGNQQSAWENLCDQHQFNIPHTIVQGGNTRYQSVKNGLAVLPDCGFVAIHDGARPLIRPETIRYLFDEAFIHSNAVPAVSPKDSLRWSDHLGNRVMDRNLIKIIQTPQVFELNKLKAAYVQQYEEAFTDDATVWEQAGNSVYLADGQESNIKITRPEDLIIA